MSKSGSIIVITGGMKSGKSEEILRRARRARIAGLSIQAFKPDTDRRFEEGKVISRDSRAEDCVLVPASNPEYIFSILEKNTSVVIIDEAQFFAPGKKLKSVEKMPNSGNAYYVEDSHSIVEVVQKLCDRGLEVIVAGLDMDSDRQSFGPMPHLMAIADQVLKLHAVCEVCYQPAVHSFANFWKTGQIAVGDKEYVATCRACLKLVSDKSSFS